MVRHRLLLPLLVASLAWGAYYIFRTSFVIEGERVFSLWDDGMISMRYARNLVLGNGLVWNVGEAPVQGFSNPGVTLSMAALHLLPFSATKVSLAFQLLNLALFGAALLCVARLARKLFGDADPDFALACSAAVALCAPAAIWSLQGSDVGFAMIWLLVCVELLCGSDAQRDRALPWVAGLGVLIRPDLLLFAGVILCATLLQPGAYVRRFITGAAVTATAAALLLVFGQLYYGDWLPNTVYLKVSGLPRGQVLATGFAHLQERLPSLLPALALAVVASWRAGRKAIAVHTAAALVIASIAYNTWVGGDWLRSYESRFVAPTLPLLLILAVAGARDLLDWALPRRLANTPARGALLVLAAVALAWQSNPRHANRDWLDPSATTMYRNANERNARYGFYLRDHSAPDTTIAVYWGGVPPYFSERFSIDVLGKSDRHIAKQPVARFTQPGHSKQDWDYVLNVRKPDVFLHATPPLKERDDFRSSYYFVRNPEVALYVRKQSVEKLLGQWLILEDLETGQLLERRAGSAKSDETR